MDYMKNLFSSGFASALYGLKIQGPFGRFIKPHFTLKNYFVRLTLRFSRIQRNQHVSNSASSCLKIFSHECALKVSALPLAIKPKCFFLY